jgi:hypothetical protein
MQHPDVGKREVVQQFKINRTARRFTGTAESKEGFLGRRLDADKIC